MKVSRAITRELQNILKDIITTQLMIDIILIIFIIILKEKLISIFVYSILCL